MLSGIGSAAAVILMLGTTGEWAGAQPAPDKIAVSVNGDVITESEFYSRMQALRAQDFVASTNPLTLRSESGGQLVLNSLINERLILQWAAKTKDMPPDSEVEADLEGLKRQPNIAQALANKTVSEDLLRYDIRVQRARFNIATVAVTVTPQEVEAYYKKHKELYSTPERWGLSAIRTTNPDNIFKVKSALKAGKPFEDVVKQYSDDPSSKNKGVLGVANSNDPKLPIPIREAVKKLAVGDVSPPIKIEFDPGKGKATIPVWYFMRLTSKEPPTTVPFADVKAQIERQAMLERAGGFAVADKKIDQYRQSAKIEVMLPSYQYLAVPAKK